MNAIDDGGSAFPCANPDYDGNWNNQLTTGGMSLRDYFAAAALPMIPHVGCGGDLDSNELARAAYQIADAMLAARKEDNHD